MAANLDGLKQNIMNVIKDNDYSFDDLVEVLSPISAFINEPVFKNNIEEIISIISKDRNGNQKFDVGDLQALCKDFGAITPLITAVFLLIGAIPQIKLEYSAGETEEIIFKILAYVFLVIVPKQTGAPWGPEEKQQVVDITLTVYGMIKSSQFVQNLIAKVNAWLKQKGWCKCMTTDENPAVEAKLPKLKMDLQLAMNNVRDKSELMAEIKALKSRMA